MNLMEGRKEQNHFLFFISLVALFLAVLLGSGAPFGFLTPPAEVSQTSEFFEEDLDFDERVSLWLAPAQSTAKVGQELNFSLNVNSQELLVSAATLELLFEPAYLSFQKISLGDFFQNATILDKSVDEEGGRIILSVGGLPTQAGSGEILRFKFLVKELSEKAKTTVSLGKQTGVAALGEPENVLGSTVEATLTILP